MSAPRSLLWRLVPWLLPPLLILVGLIFVAISLTGNDRPDDIVAPPNVREITTASAGPWAQRQVGPGTTSTVTGVLLAESSATDSSTYSVRAVISRVDAPTGLETTTSINSTANDDSGVDTRVRTVVTCVRWDVDVRTGTVVEHGATQLSNDPGQHELGDSGRLSSQCRAATFAD